MNFIEKSKKYYVLSNRSIALTVINFQIVGELFDDGREIVDKFIKLPQDFEFARKYVGGYICDHTNEFGQNKIFKFYNFGPYPIDLLEIEDYKISSIDEFKNQSLSIFSLFNCNNEIDFIHFIADVKNCFKEIMINSHNFYQLLPSNWKYNDLGAFNLEYYLCAFSINRIEKKFTVIQIDDD